LNFFELYSKCFELHNYAEEFVSVRVNKQVVKFVLAQQSLQPELSRRCCGMCFISSVEQHGLQEHTELSQCQW